MIDFFSLIQSKIHIKYLHFVEQARLYILFIQLYFVQFRDLNEYGGYLNKIEIKIRLI